MNLVRLGHYFIPTDDKGHGSCQTALVVGLPRDGIVNLTVWDSDGDNMRHLDVPVINDPDPRVTGEQPSASFHLSGYCPWKR